MSPTPMCTLVALAGCMRMKSIHPPTPAVFGQNNSLEEITHSDCFQKCYLYFSDVIALPVLTEELRTLLEMCQSV
jgi:hypothetical protein